MYKALKSFGGVVSMVSGEIRDISNPLVVDDLVKAGYIVEVKPAKDKAKEEAEVKPANSEAEVKPKKTTKKTAKDKAKE